MEQGYQACELEWVKRSARICQPMRMKRLSVARAAGCQWPGIPVYEGSRLVLLVCHGFILFGPVKNCGYAADVPHCCNAILQVGSRVDVSLDAPASKATVRPRELNMTAIMSMCYEQQML